MGTAFYCMSSLALPGSHWYLGERLGDGELKDLANFSLIINI